MNDIFFDERVPFLSSVTFVKALIATACSTARLIQSSRPHGEQGCERHCGRPQKDVYFVILVSMFTISSRHCRLKGFFASLLELLKAGVTTLTTWT
jgi:hypothetical protein